LKKDDDWRYKNLYGNEWQNNNKEPFKLIEEVAVKPKVLEPVKESIVIPKVVEPVKELIILPKEIVAPVVAPEDAFQLILQKMESMSAKQEESSRALLDQNTNLLKVVTQKNDDLRTELSHTIDEKVNESKNTLCNF
jgi:hypothetical protein